MILVNWVEMLVIILQHERFVFLQIPKLALFYLTRYLVFGGKAEP